MAHLGRIHNHVDLRTARLRGLTKISGQLQHHRLIAGNQRFSEWSRLAGDSIEYGESLSLWTKSEATWFDDRLATPMLMGSCSRSFARLKTVMNMTGKNKLKKIERRSLRKF